MKMQGTLSQQVEAYHNWKKELIRQIGRYRLWLKLWMCCKSLRS